MNVKWKKWICRLFLVLVIITIFSHNGYAEPVLPFPNIDIGVRSAETPEDVGVGLQILFLLTFLSLAPAILVMVTSFTRIIVVLSFMRSAIGTQQMPPNQILVGLALFLTVFIMTPVWNQVNAEGLQPYLQGQISQEEAFDQAIQPVRNFMFKETREKDLALFVNLADIEQPKDSNDIPTYVLIPSFIISELKTAFEIGFVIFIPFIVIDMVVASTLMSMGMMMLPPAMISLPFKIMLFILVDGWHLIIRSLVQSF